MPGYGGGIGGDGSGGNVAGAGGGSMQEGRNPRPGDQGKKRKRVKTLLDWIDPRGPQVAYVEGRENWGMGNTQRKPGIRFARNRGGQITRDENTRRLALVDQYRKEDAARAKIKPIKDPEGDKSVGRRRSATRKQRGRAGSISVGTTLSAGRQTLG